jgi:hypothetical protein
MKLPMVLDEIVLQLRMLVRIFNIEICLKKSLAMIGVPIWPHSATNVVKEEFQAQIPLILDDHIVKDHTSCHDVNENFLIPKMSWTPNNGKPSLQSTKSSFNILSTCFLCFCKFSMFLCLGLLNGLPNVAQDG